VSLSFIQNRLDQLNRFHILLLLTILGLFTYANAIWNPFVHDDVIFIEKNPYINDLNLRNIFVQTTVPDEKFPLVNQYYRPLLEFTNRLLNQIFQLNPHGFHFFNVLLHILNSFLVYNVIRFLTRDRKGVSLCIAAIFLIHPVQSEAVACISGISNLMFTFFTLTAFYLYLTAFHSDISTRKNTRYGLSLVLFFVGLLAKEQTVILPILIIVYEGFYAPEKNKGALKKGKIIIGYFFVLAGYFLVRKYLFGFMLTPVAGSRGELWLRLLAIPRSLLTYLGLMFFPHELYYYRSQDVLLPLLWPWILFFIIAGGILWLVFQLDSVQKKWALLGLSWFVVSLLPVLNIVPLINEYSLILTSEHFLYFPIIGMLLYIASLVTHWLESGKSEQKYIWNVMVVLTLSFVFCGMTIKQNTYWRGEIPLFERTLTFQPNFGRVHALLAKAYVREGRLVDAVEEDRKALEIMHGYIEKINDEQVKLFYMGFMKGVHYHRGFCLDVLGEKRKALGEFLEAVKYPPENDATYYAVGLAYVKVGDLENAAVHFKKAVDLNTDHLMAMNSLALCYREFGNRESAEKLLREIVLKDPESASARQNLKNFLEGED